MASGIGHINVGPTPSFAHYFQRGQRWANDSHCLDSSRGNTDSNTQTAGPASTSASKDGTKHNVDPDNGCTGYNICTRHNNPTRHNTGISRVGGTRHDICTRHDGGTRRNVHTEHNGSARHEDDPWPKGQ